MPLRTIIVKAALFTVATSSAPAPARAPDVAEILRLIQSRPASPLRELELPELPALAADKSETETETAEANSEN